MRHWMMMEKVLHTHTHKSLDIFSVSYNMYIIMQLYIIHSFDVLSNLSVCIYYIIHNRESAVCVSNSAPFKTKKKRKNILMDRTIGPCLIVFYIVEVLLGVGAQWNWWSCDTLSFLFFIINRRWKEKKKNFPLSHLLTARSDTQHTSILLLLRWKIM